MCPNPSSPISASTLLIRAAESGLQGKRRAQHKKERQSLYSIEMTKTERIAYWIEIADYDYDTAGDMYTSGRWIYVAFMCHQAIEKTLKAYWCAVSDDDPPYTHSHHQLATATGLVNDMNDEQIKFLASMTQMNIEARYPSYKEGLSRQLNRDNCRIMLDDTKRLLQWIKGKLLEKTMSSNS